jgi:hypothetical protein
MADREVPRASRSDRLRVAVWRMLVEKNPMMPYFRGELRESGARPIIEYLQRSR